MEKELIAHRKLSKSKVLETICSWNLRFPECVRDVNILNFLANEYFEDLESEDVTPEEFDHACRVVRKKCTFFPKVADILSVVHVARSKVGGHTF